MKKRLDGLVIHWLTSDRFDTKPDKSSWTEVGHALSLQGAQVNIITSYAKSHYKPQKLLVNMVYLKSLDFPLIYRVAFTFSVFFWLARNAGRRDLIILNQHELWVLPLLRIARFKRIHLDIRTLPVKDGSLKSKLDILLFWKLVMKLFSTSCDSHSFITKRLLDVVESEFSIKFKNLTIWQSGVNYSFFSSVNGSIRRDRKQSKPFTVFYHGSLYERRGLNRVVEAFSKLSSDIIRQSRFVIVGDGNGLPGLREQIKTFGLEDKIELRGFIPYEDVPLQISEADICICPLPDYPEWNVSSPLKVLEYMACAKPMILTPIPAHKDILEGSKFVIWAKGDQVEHFSEAITKGFYSIEQLSIDAAIAPQIVKNNWDWNAHGERLGMFLADQYLSESDTSYTM